MTDYKLLFSKFEGIEFREGEREQQQIKLIPNHKINYKDVTLSA
jgi:hypothetical protein